MSNATIDRRRLTAFGLAGSIVATASTWLFPAATLAHGIPAASPWSTQKFGPMRLIAGTVAPSGVGSPKLYAGVHIKLDPGWKTYWRQPGDSGVPPSLDWQGSANLAAARVLFPAPVRLQDGGLTMLGYKSEVVLPVEITPKDPAQAVELKLTAEYGVCKDICIPAEAKLSLILPPQAGAGEGVLIGNALQYVPQATGAGLPSIRTIKQDMTGSTPRIVLDATFPKGSEGADAFIEIEGGELAPLPAVIDRKGNDIRFEAKFASVEEAKRFAGNPLVVTLVSKAAQSEVRTKVE